MARIWGSAKWRYFKKKKKKKKLAARGLRGLGRPLVRIACRDSPHRLTPTHGQSSSAAPAAAFRADRHQPARRAGGALSRLRALHHHGARASRRARRAEARAPPHSLRHARPQARPRLGFQEMRQDCRRRDGVVPSARRSGHLRGAGASRPGLRLALPADRGPGQFRQHRRGQRRRLSLHRGAHDRRRPPAHGGRRGRRR